MKAFVWIHWECKSEYVVFAETKEEAIAHLKTIYKPEDVDKKLLKVSRFEEREMPKGLVTHNKVKWL